MPEPAQESNALRHLFNTLPGIVTPSCERGFPACPEGGAMGTPGRSYASTGLPPARIADRSVRFTYCLAAMNGPSRRPRDRPENPFLIVVTDNDIIKIGLRRVPAEFRMVNPNRNSSLY